MSEERTSAQDDLKKERWASDEVTSPPLYSLDQGSEGSASEAD